MKKKYIFIIVIGILILSTFSIFTFQKTSHSKSIHYQIIFDGFVELDDPSSELPMCDGAFVFSTSEQWKTFTSKYFKRLPSFLGRLNIPIDFENQKLFCELVTPTNEDYIKAFATENITLEDNLLVIHFSENKSNTYVLGSSNEDASIFFYIVLATVDNTDELSHLNNNYQ